MNLFFEHIISRRDFLKKSALVALGGAIFSKLIKFDSAQTIGLIKAQRALYFKKLPANTIKCLLCPRQCIVPDKKRGFCRVRENKGGEYYSQEI